MVPIDHFDSSAADRLGQPAIIDGGLTCTYAELTAMSRRIGAAIARYGDDGEPVPAVIYAPNSYRVLATMVGIMRAGGVIVPVHAPNTAEMSLPFLSQVHPRCLFYDSSRAGEVQQLRAALPSVRECICLDRRIGTDRSLADVLAAADDWEATWIDVTGNADRPVFYWATSGTTGEPKVVVETVRCFDAMLKTARRLRGPGRHVSLALAPMSHGGGPACFETLTLGGTVINVARFDAREVLETIERYRVTETWLSPTALYLLLDCAELRRYDLSSLHSVLLGMAGVSPEKLKRAVAMFGPCISQTYGQIETSFVTALDAAVVAEAVDGIRPERLASSGRSVYMSRFAIMDEDGRLLPPGEQGEIVVRGTGVKHYLDPAATAVARRFGWHHTGDLGYQDGDGFLYVVGRIKDVVNMAGYKIAAAEVERAIMALPEVQECAVVGVPDAVRGETVKAIVVARPGATISMPAVLRHCRARLGNGKAPHSAALWPSLPRTPVGKIDKRRIREQLASGIPAGAA